MLQAYTACRLLEQLAESHRATNFEGMLVLLICENFTCRFTGYDAFALLPPFWCCKNGINVNNVIIGHCGPHDHIQVH